jgi:hypothetical protein
LATQALLRRAEVAAKISRDLAGCSIDLRGTRRARGHDMPKRVSPVFIVPAILGAALAGYFLTSHRSATAAASIAPVEAVKPTTPAPASLPPNHPHVPGMSPHGGPPHASGAMPNGENQRPPSIDWKVPGGWQTVANPNPMRLATYRITDAAEASVARAGGPVDANVLRWSQQFDGAPQPDRSEKQVSGLHVTVVRLAGTYEGGMGMGTPEKHDGWAMLAAIVEAPGAPYFFKVVGPAADVDRARGSFDSLVDSVTPHAAQ